MLAISLPESLSYKFEILLPTLSSNIESSISKQNTHYFDCCDVNGNVNIIKKIIMAFICNKCNKWISYCCIGERQCQQNICCDGFQYLECEQLNKCSNVPCNYQFEGIL